MHEIKAAEITKEVARLCQEANFFLPDDVVAALEAAQKAEESLLGKEVISQMIENARLARSNNIPICQDTGMAVVFLELGQNVLIKGELIEAINEGVRQGYAQGYLRKSVVKEPLFLRQNTSDNTPALIHLESVPGEELKISLLVKGGGSESVGKAKVLIPAEGIEGVKRFVLEVIEEAGASPCPPSVVGVGCGGSLDMAALLAKKALLRSVGQASGDSQIARLEQELLNEINKLGIGPAGLGGRLTSLAVHIETYPSHIATLPVAVEVNCYALRRKEATL